MSRNTHICSGRVYRRSKRSLCYLQSKVVEHFLNSIRGMNIPLNFTKEAKLNFEEANGLPMTISILPSRGLSPLLQVAKRQCNTRNLRSRSLPVFDCLLGDVTKKKSTALCCPALQNTALSASSSSSTPFCGIYTRGIISSSVLTIQAHTIRRASVAHES